VEVLEWDSEVSGENDCSPVTILKDSTSKVVVTFDTADCSDRNTVQNI